MTKTIHTFHIPVMGTAFTIDSPAKVAKYGISSVISCVDDVLIEKMRRFYCSMMGEECNPIEKTDPDARANRITAYLNLLDRMVKDQVEKLKQSAFEIGSEIHKYFELLPEASALKQMYLKMQGLNNAEEQLTLQEELRKRIEPGSIDINIMTKLDRTNFAVDGTPLGSEFNDAMAALRGYARSTLASSIVFSAGFNGRLYSYVEKFKDFHANDEGFIKKKIVIKVNDFRSAMTQGKFFAKKGLWVSEYRVESGLNCGGHAFAHGGNLMGPSLEEFKKKKEELVSSLFEVYNKALAQKGRKTFEAPHPVRITAQGGIGTARENQFLLDHYQLDGTGWGTPFLLVPEATTVDHDTLEKLCGATREELFLSNVSPLGVPFNNLRNSSSEEHKGTRIREGRPGSSCAKGFLVSNTEYSKKPVCLASRFYQKKKLEELSSMELDRAQLKEQQEAIMDKACLCNDLAGAALLLYNLHEEGEPPPKPAICPGPNLAYFSRTFSLKEMVDHIYGRTDVLGSISRPHMFMAELQMYIDYLEREVREYLAHPNEQRARYLREYRDDLIRGMEYYEELIPHIRQESSEDRSQMLKDLNHCRSSLESLSGKYSEFL